MCLTGMVKERIFLVWVITLTSIMSCEISINVCLGKLEDTSVIYILETTATLESAFFQTLKMCLPST